MADSSAEERDVELRRAFPNVYGNPVPMAHVSRLIAIDILAGYAHG